MRNGFLRGPAGQLAAASVAIVAVISAAIWCTIRRYESASNSSSVALNAISVSGDTYSLEIHFQDEKDAATRYVLAPSPAFRQANVAARDAFAAPAGRHPGRHAGRLQRGPGPGGRERAAFQRRVHQRGRDPGDPPRQLRCAR